MTAIRVWVFICLVSLSLWLTTQSFGQRESAENRQWIPVTFDPDDYDDYNENFTFPPRGNDLPPWTDQEWAAGHTEDGVADPSNPIGKYPDYLAFDVNRPECGLRYEPTVHNIRFPNKCFDKKFEPKVYYDLEGNNLLYKKPSTQTRVSSGTVTEYGEAPWTVLVKRVIGRLPGTRWHHGHCTGTLITFEWVVTAAHCGTSWTHQTPVQIFAGSHKFEDGQIRYMSKWFPHPTYMHRGWISIDPRYKRYLQFMKKTDSPEARDNFAWAYDIALLKVYPPFPRGLKDGRNLLLNPICLPLNLSNVYVGKATFYGFGTMPSSIKIIPFAWPDYMMKGDITISRCNLDEYCVHWDDPPKGEPPPKGDSGGPLVVFNEHMRGVLIGDCSSFSPKPAWWDPRGCPYVTKATWAAVPHYIDWILNTIFHE